MACDISIYENVWEMVLSMVYALPIVGVICGTLWYLVKKTSYND